MANARAEIPVGADQQVLIGLFGTALRERLLAVGIPPGTSWAMAVEEFVFRGTGIPEGDSVIQVFHRPGLEISQAELPEPGYLGYLGAVGTGREQTYYGIPREALPSVSEGVARAIARIPGTDAEIIFSNGGSTIRLKRFEGHLGGNRKESSFPPDTEEFDPNSFLATLASLPLKDTQVFVLSTTAQVSSV